nr:vegetative cell wall protein gp1-like [Aegilops tauschii subsp. strangulata]
MFASSSPIHIGIGGMNPWSRPSPTRPHCSTPTPEPSLAAAARLPVARSSPSSSSTPTAHALRNPREAPLLAPFPAVTAACSCSLAPHRYCIIDAALLRPPHSAPRHGHTWTGSALRPARGCRGPRTPARSQPRQPRRRFPPPPRLLAIAVMHAARTDPEPSLLLLPVAAHCMSGPPPRRTCAAAPLRLPAPPHWLRVAAAAPPCPRAHDTAPTYGCYCRTAAPPASPTVARLHLLRPSVHSPRRLLPAPPPPRLRSASPAPRR